jgi:putative transcriptional regulator
MPASTMVKLDPVVVGGNSLPLCIGGPVEPERGWLLLADPPESSEYRTICDGLYLSTSPTLLRHVLSTSPPPRARVLAGYAGWGPGQLDEELAQSAWLIGNVDLDLIFDVAPDDMWQTAIRRLGADPSSLQMSHGVH